MKAFNVNVRIGRQEDGLWRAEVPQLDGCFVDAPTLQEALDGIQEVVAMFIDLFEEYEKDLPASVSPTRDDEFDARLPVRVDEHKIIRKSPRRAKSALR
jgi:predicted RNase H-like HicB family nuclease